MPKTSFLAMMQDTCWGHMHDLMAYGKCRSNKAKKENKAKGFIEPLVHYSTLF